MVNQILFVKNNYNDMDFFIQKSNKRNYKLIFSISISIVFILIFYLLFSYFGKLIQKERTDKLIDKYHITSLYSSNNHYDAIKLSNEISIIGLIEIPAINLSYPILSNSNEALLKISVCRFSGPFPNRDGNLCIAGHNYRNNMMFSKLYKLKINDSIYITDLNNVRLEYVIYEKYKVKQSNLDCTSNTANAQVTLITCNENNNKERIVVKAKVKE